MTNSPNETPRERQQEDLAASILDYLAEHPQAMDSLDGIAEWWIMRQEVRVLVETVERAVRRLVGSGLLEEVQTASGDYRYQLKRASEDQAADRSSNSS